MRQYALLFFLAVGLVFSIYAQEDYYWSDGKKIPLVENTGSAIVYFEEPVDPSYAFEKVSASAIAQMVSFHSRHNRVLVQFTPSLTYVPLEYLDKALNLQDLPVKSISFGRTLEDGYEMWLSHRIVLRMARGREWQEVFTVLKGQKVTYIEKKYGNILLEIADMEQVLPVANTIRESGLVEFCHPDFYAPVTFSDPLYPQQFQLDNAGQIIDGYPGTPDVDIDAPDAWDLTTGSSFLKVAVIDDGLEDHEDLRDEYGISRLRGGYTPLSGGDGSPTKNGRHGQACAGIIAASHNELGIRGIAPEVELISVNIFAGNESPTDIANGITWAKNQGADILSNSWGYTSCSANFSVLTQAINDAAANGRGGMGCVIVFASGNGYKSCVDYPAKLESVIAVGAVTSQGAISPYSNQGPELDLVAPSSGAAAVRTIDREGSAGYNGGNYHNNFGGTSAACPVVAGVAALVLAIDPSFSSSEVRDIITQSAIDMGTPGFDNIFGNGRVNAYQALLCAQNGANCEGVGGDDTTVEKGGGNDDDAGGRAEYCTPGGGNSNFEFIQRVQLQNIDNKSGNDGGYGDFTELQAELTPDSSYTITLTPGFSGSPYTEFWRVWIDFNGDLDFEDPGELVADGYGKGPIDREISIPSDAVLGNTRMRITMQWNSYATSCQNPNYGEVEDYSILITKNASTPPSPQPPFPELPPILLEHGMISGVDSSWQIVSLKYDYEDKMVVVATVVQPDRYSHPAVTRIRNAEGASFEIRIQEPGGKTTGARDVHFVVVEEGVYTQEKDGVTMEAVKTSSSITADNNDWDREVRGYQNEYSEPVVLGQVMTSHDPDWSAFWSSRYNSRTNPPSFSGFAAGKHAGEDIDAFRAIETIGYIVIEAGNGSIGNIDYTAGIGDDIVRGTGNSASGYRYPVNSLSSASTAVLSSAGMDGSDGGWPVLFGHEPLTSTSLTLAIDEDQIKDNERTHTTEQVAYWVFGSSAGSNGPELAAIPDHALPSFEEKLVVFPNPAKTEINIRAEIEQENGSVIVLDASGRLLKRLQIESGETYTLNTSGWSQGTYYVLTKGREGKVMTQQVILHK